jgi:hypothetical protein
VNYRKFCTRPNEEGAMANLVGPKFNPRVPVSNSKLVPCSEFIKILEFDEVSPASGRNAAYFLCYMQGCGPGLDPDPGSGVKKFKKFQWQNALYTVKHPYFGQSP